MARRVLSFVLSGGGARGALQVGALRALLEADLRPDLLVGTSIGACNAGFLALNGLTLASIDRLQDVWREAIQANLLPPNYLWATFRALFSRRVDTAAEARLRAFWMRHGLTSDIRFGDIQGVRLVMVSSNLNQGKLLLYGTAPDDNLLEGLLATTALPPWIRPIRKQGHLLIDGGFLSNLPIEPALAQGATEIIAIDLSDPLPDRMALATGFRPGVFKLAWSVQQRQIELERRLAEVQGIPVRLIELHANPPVATSDFSRTEELMAVGYEETRRKIEQWQPASRTRFWTAPEWLARSAGRVAQRRKVA